MVKILGGKRLILFGLYGYFSNVYILYNMLLKWWITFMLTSLKAEILGEVA